MVAWLRDTPVASVMTPDPVTVREEDTVAAAWEVLARGHFHHLPVVRGGRGVGVLDDRAVVGTCGPGDLVRRRRRVGELLGGDAPTVGPATTLAEVARIMAHRVVDAVAVVDSAGDLVGVVTTTDVVGALAAVLDAT